MISKNVFLGKIETKKSILCDLLTCYFILGTDGKDMETKFGQEKFIWSNAMINDMIDIICSDEILKFL